MNKKAVIGIIGLLLLAIALADKDKDRTSPPAVDQAAQRTLNEQVDYWLSSNTIQSKLKRWLQPRENKNHDA